jgi:hypothetical protein
MYKDIKNWVLSCMDCVMKKTRIPKELGESTGIVTTEPLEILGMDFIGPLPRTKRGNKYILVFVDLFTRWPEAFAIKKPNGKTVAKHFLQNIVCRYGTPKSILSDRGKAFIQGMMAAVQTELKIYHRKTTPYHPRTNGLVERFNRTLVNTIAMYVSSFQDDWDDYLPYALFAYRTAINEATQQSPYYLMFIRDPHLPTDLVDHTFQTPQKENNKLLEMEELHQKVLLLDQKAKSEREIRSTMQQHPFKVGELVLMYQPFKKKGLTKKLAYPSRGPFRIIQLKEPNHAKLKSLSGKIVDHWVHVNTLTKYWQGAIDQR